MTFADKNEFFEFFFKLFHKSAGDMDLIILANILVFSKETIYLRYLIFL